MTKSIDIKFRKVSKSCSLQSIIVNKVVVGNFYIEKYSDTPLFYVKLILDQTIHHYCSNKIEAKLWIKNVLTKYLAWRNLVTGPKIIKAHKDYLAASQ